MYLINNISLSDVCLIVHHWCK